MLDQQPTKAVTASDSGKTEAPKPVEKPLEIRTGHFFEVTTPEGLVSETGIRELQDYMFAQGFGLLPADFEPMWATRRGTLPKRLSAHVYKAHQLRMTPQQVSEVGNIARRNTSTAQTYVMDFTKSIDWSAGDFGDSGSCFWGDKSGAREMIEEHGYAVRLYRKRQSDGPVQHGNVRGYARAWLAPIDGNRVIVFNGYGETGLTIARLLSVKWGCSYKRIALTNNGTDGGVLWVNGGGSYVLGAWPKIEEMKAHNLEWEEIEGEPETYCACCDTHLDEDDIVSALNRYGDSVDCCEGCSFYCDHCNETYTEDVMRSLDGESYCSSCRDEIQSARRQEKLDEIERLERELEDQEDQKSDLQEQIKEVNERIDEIEEKLSDLREEVEA